MEPIDCMIEEVLAAPAVGAFFFDDQAAIKAGATRDGFAILGQPVTPGFEAVRQPAQAVSIMLRLSDGFVANGDCVAVQYSGVGGRDPLLRSDKLVPLIEDVVATELVGRRVDSFRRSCVLVDQFVAEIPGFGSAAAYGLSQALLDAAAHVNGRSMARTIQSEWDLDTPMRRLSLFAQSGEQRRDNVDKMILRQVDVLPHGLINDTALVGAEGERLIDYVRWVSQRVQKLRRDPEFEPILHFDVYGTIGLLLEQDLDDIAAVLIAMEAAAKPFQLRVEQPLDVGSRAGQIEQMAALRQLLRERGSAVQLVVDEWANTVDDIRAFNRAGAADMVQIKAPDLGGLHHSVEAILDCHAYDVLTHFGGSCTESDRSARTCLHVAMAAGVSQVLAKPGMGVDEGLCIVTNEMSRILRLEGRPAQGSD